MIKENLKIRDPKGLQSFLFKFFYELLHLRKTSISVASSYIIISFLQTFGMKILNESTTYDQTIFEIAFRGFFKIILIKPLLVTLGVGYLSIIFLYFILAYFLIHLVLISIIMHMIKIKKTYLQFPLSFIKMNSLFLYWVLILPIMDTIITLYSSDPSLNIILSVTTAWSIFHSVNLIIFTIIGLGFFIITLCYSIFNNETSFCSQDSFARQNWNFELVFYLERIASSIFILLNFYSPLIWLELIMEIIISIYLGYSVFCFFPFFNEYTAYFINASFFSYIWITICILIRHLLYSIDYTFTGLVYSVVIGWCLILYYVKGMRESQEYSLITTSSYKKITNHTLFIHYITVFKKFITDNKDNKYSSILYSVINKHNSECINPLCPLNDHRDYYFPLTNEWSHAENRTIFDKIVLMYLFKGMFVVRSIIGKVDSTFFIDNSILNLFVIGMHLNAFNLLAQGEKYDPYLKEKFIIFRFMSESKYFLSINYAHEVEELKTAALKLNPLSVIRYEKLFENFRKQVEVSSNSQIDFWNYLCSENPQVELLSNLGIKASVESTKVKEIWKEMELIYEHYRPGIMLYQDYLKYVTEDEEEISSLIKKSSLSDLSVGQDEHFERKDSMFSNMAAVIIASAEENNIGTIINVSQAIKNLLGNEQNEIIGQNISIFIPPLINEQHNDIMLDYLKTGHKYLMNREKTMIALNKKRFLISIFLVIREYVGMKEGSCFLTLMKLAFSGIDLIFTTSAGRILAISEGIELIFKITPAFLEENQVSIFHLCPNLVPKSITENESYASLTGEMDAEFYIPINLKCLSEYIHNLEKDPSKKSSSYDANYFEDKKIIVSIEFHHLEIKKKDLSLRIIRIFRKAEEMEKTVSGQDNFERAITLYEEEESMEQNYSSNIMGRKKSLRHIAINFSKNNWLENDEEEKVNANNPDNPDNTVNKEKNKEENKEDPSNENSPLVNQSENRAENISPEKEEKKSQLNKENIQQENENRTPSESSSTVSLEKYFSQLRMSNSIHENPPLLNKIKIASILIILILIVEGVILYIKAIGGFSSLDKYTWYFKDNMNRGRSIVEIERAVRTLLLYQQTYISGGVTYSVINPSLRTPTSIGFDYTKIFFPNEATMTYTDWLQNKLNVYSNLLVASQSNISLFTNYVSQNASNFINPPNVSMVLTGSYSNLLSQNMDMQNSIDLIATSAYSISKEGTLSNIKDTSIAVNAIVNNCLNSIMYQLNSSFDSSLIDINNFFNNYHIVLVILLVISCITIVSMQAIFTISFYYLRGETERVVQMLFEIPISVLQKNIENGKHFLNMLYNSKNYSITSEEDKKLGDNAAKSSFIDLAASQKPKFEKNAKIKEEVKENLNEEREMKKESIFNRLQLIFKVGFVLLIISGLEISFFIAEYIYLHNGMSDCSLKHQELMTISNLAVQYSKSLAFTTELVATQGTTLIMNSNPFTMCNKQSTIFQNAIDSMVGIHGYNLALFNGTTYTNDFDNYVFTSICNQVNSSISSYCLAIFGGIMNKGYLSGSYYFWNGLRDMIADYGLQNTSALKEAFRYSMFNEVRLINFEILEEMYFTITSEALISSLIENIDKSNKTINIINHIIFWIYLCTIIIILLIGWTMFIGYIKTLIFGATSLIINLPLNVLMRSGKIKDYLISKSKGNHASTEKREEN